MNRLTNTAKMIFAECSAIQRMTSTTSTVPMPLTIAPSCTVAIFLVGDRNRSGQPDPRAVLAGEIEIGRGLPDRVGRVLAGLERVVVEHRLELDEGARSESVSGLSLTSSRQENVAVPLFRTSSTVWRSG